MDVHIRAGHLASLQDITRLSAWATHHADLRLKNDLINNKGQCSHKDPVTPWLRDTFAENTKP